MEDGVDEAVMGNLGEAEEGRVFMPDIMTPAQFFDSCKKTAHIDQGVHRLMMAMLEVAVTDWQHGFPAANERARRYAIDADEWIFGEVQDGPFSFDNICAALGIDAGYLRGGLRKWREAYAAGEAHPIAHVQAHQNQARTTSQLKPARERGDGYLLQGGRFRPDAEF